MSDDAATADWAMRIVQMWAESISAYSVGDYVRGRAIMDGAEMLAATGPMLPTQFECSNHYKEFKVSIDELSMASAQSSIKQIWPITFGWPLAEEEETRIPEKNPLPREHVPSEAELAKIGCPRCGRKKPLFNIGKFECWWCDYKWSKR